MVQASMLAPPRRVIGGAKRLADNMGRDISNGAAPGWRTSLVAYDTQFASVLRQTLHGEQEILAACTIDPTGAQNQVRHAGGTDGLLASQFAFTVHIQRIGGIRFHVRSCSAAIKYIVSAVVDQRSPQFECLLGHHCRSLRVHQHCHFLVAFRLVNGGVRCRVDDQIWPDSTYLLAHLLQVAQVHVFTPKRDNLADALKAAFEFVSDLPGLAGDQNFHANTSAAANSVPCRSLPDSSGSPSSGQVMPSAGSFHSRLRSNCGAQEFVVF
jgi:hypothetical protein